MASLDININQVNADFQGIKTAIVEKGVEVADGTPTSEYADKVSDVYEAGKTAEWNEFWDNFQNYGGRKSYARAFVNYWTDTIFKPKYDMYVTNANQMFYTTLITDIVDIINKQNIIIDFSNCTDFTNVFAHSKYITRVGEIDTRSCDSLNAIWYNSDALETIEKWILKDDGSQKLTNIFSWNYALANIVVEGVIGDTLSIIHSTKLTKTSILSIFNALSDTSTDKTLTLSKKAVNNAFETAEGLADGSTSEEWLNLIATKPNWTISI